MSEERPPSDDAARDDAAQERTEGERRAADADAWATACAEDLEAEKARRRAQYGPPPGSAAEELRKLVDTVADKLSSLRSPLLGPVAGPAAQEMVRQVVQQARAAVEPVRERNPDVFGHLAAAGGELLAAYRSAVQAQERRWTSRTGGAEDGRGDGGLGEDGPRRGPQDGPHTRPGGDGEGPGDRRDKGEGTGGGERIDLD
nr:carbon catabolit repression protein [Streptomyces sp. Xyl84]